jgi:hypothetical protein
VSRGRDEMKTGDETIIYSLNIEDLQTVAEETLNRKLSATEIDLVKDKVGDYIPWFDAIQSAIEDHIVNVKTL